MAKKKHKIMTVTDLYNFCVKNNFCHFSSLDDNEEICVQLPATFESEENFDKDKEGLTPFVAKAYHDHINLNKSEIKPEVLESTLPSAMLRPILASIVVDEESGEKDFGSHDFTVEQDEDGNEVFKYIEQPVGIIFGENYIEYDEEDDVNRAILHGYLFDGYCQDAVDIMNRRGSVACSVELSIREMSYNAADKVLTLDDFYVSGLTLLGASVKPGMKNSKLTIKDFCKKGNTTFSQDSKLIEMLEQLNTKIDNLSNFTIQANAEETNRKEEQFVESNKNFEEVVETIEAETTVVEMAEEVTDEVVEGATEESTEEVVTEETSEETTEESTEVTPDVVVEESVEEVETKTEETTETETPEVTEEFVEEVTETETVVEEVSVKPEKYSITMSDGSIKEFALSLEDINNALWTLVNETYSEADDSYYSVIVYEDNTLVMVNWWNAVAYRQKFKREDDNFSLVGDREKVVQIWVSESEEQAINEMKANYASLVQFKADTENAELHAQREAILYDAKYSVLAEKDENDAYKNEAYAKLVSEMDNYSLADLEKELKSVFADHITNGGQFAYAGEEKTTVTKKLFASSSSSKKSSRYGNLFNK